MRKLYPCMLFALWSLYAHAQLCPAILNCPQGALLIHDLSTNDSSLWNKAPYTWSPTVSSPDLYEGAADLNIKIQRCSGGGPLTVSYILYLDLDNDNLNETVVKSTSPPSAGIIFAGNAFNPGFSGGDTLMFDRRPVPDSMLFRFALQIKTEDDTTVASLRWVDAGNSWYVPRLPEGKHRIEWTAIQGGVVRTCQYTFRVKDTQPPSLSCKQGVTVHIDTTGTGVLTYNALIQSAEDNITPFNQLQFSLRKFGTGTDFPLDSYGNPVPTLPYSCLEKGQRMVELWVKDRTGNISNCNTTVQVTGDPAICPPNHPDFCAVTYWGNGALVRQVGYDISWVDQDEIPHIRHLPVQASGCAKLDSLPAATLFSIIPQKDIHPLNGISTYDLVLISRQILGLQPFDAPWKFIAADINNNGAVTTSDVVELRRVLLGVSPHFTNNTSWRFFTAECQFPPYPFSVWCPSTLTLNTMPFDNYNGQYTFRAVKIGDVNGTAGPDSISTLPEDRSVSLLQIADQAVHPGDYLDIPVTNAELSACSGFQLALQLNPGALELISVTPGALPGLEAGSFGRPTPGLLTASWYQATPQWVLPDEPLFTLHVRALAASNLRDALHLNAGQLEPEAYVAGDETRRLDLFFKTGQADNRRAFDVYPAQPNPTSGASVIPIRLPANETIELTVYDSSGKSTFRSEQSLPAGSSVLQIPAEAFPTTGLYLFRVQAGSFTREGKIVSQ